MRSLASIAALGTLAFAGSAYAQSLAEHAAAAAGATIGTAAGKPMAKALSGIFNNVDDATATAARTGNKGAKAAIPPAPADKSASTNRGAASGVFSPGFGDSEGSPAPATADYAPRTSRPGSRRRAAQMPVSAVVMPLAMPPAAEPLKEPSLEELSAVKIGTSERDLFNALGKPESHIIVPDDDGYLRESCQFWAKGTYLGTVRLENGQVVKIEVRAQD